MIAILAFGTLLGLFGSTLCFDAFRALGESIDDPQRHLRQAIIVFCCVNGCIATGWLLALTMVEGGF